MVQIKGSVWDSVWTPKFDMKQKTDQLKHCDYNNNDEVISLNILSNNNKMIDIKKFYLFFNNTCNILNT